MSLDMPSLVTRGSTSHADPIALAQGSGSEQRLILEMALAVPTLGPGGFTGTVLAGQLKLILSWTAPTTQVPEFSF
jgi:hypothetical protein